MERRSNRAEEKEVRKDHGNLPHNKAIAPTDLDEIRVFFVFFSFVRVFFHLSLSIFYPNILLSFSLSF